jgi:HEAT repeat protein
MSERAPFALVLALVAGCAGSPGDPRGSARAAISAIEDGVDEAALDALGAEAAAALIELATDPAEPRFFRGRALLALSRYREPRVRGLLTGAASGELGALLRPEAMTALAAAFGEERPAEVAAALSPALDDPSAAIRERAARLLGALEHPAARAALARAAAGEGSAAVRRAIEEALSESPAGGGAYRAP